MCSTKCRYGCGGGGGGGGSGSSSGGVGVGVGCPAPLGCRLAGDPRRGRGRGGGFGRRHQKKQKLHGGHRDPNPGRMQEAAGVEDGRRGLAPPVQQWASRREEDPE
ncbi:hypothetical protein BDA96_10G152100 [Sorghum bicolor]|uniref:Uncharacterized protein n=1 Tax=Sorghum bicolor TaxID=4558 RepID=A0A921Q2A9_SORBI|nr:hypothetical protein BDA96_10G152100 [Sorghum bicolor]